MRLRPSHVIWMLENLYRSDGSDPERKHGGPAVLEALVRDANCPITLVAGADDMCEPCRHNRDGRCTDGLDWTPVVERQEWIERRDLSAFRVLDTVPGTTMSLTEWTELFGDRLGLLMVLSPQYEDYEPDCRKGGRQQRRYDRGIELVKAHAATGAARSKSVR